MRIYATGAENWRQKSAPAVSTGARFGGGLDFWIVCRRLYVAATDYVVWAVEQLRDSASHALTQSGCPVNGPCYVLQAFTAGCEAKNI